MAYKAPCLLLNVTPMEAFLGKPPTCKAKAVSPLGELSHVTATCTSLVRRWTDLGFNPSFDFGDVISSWSLDFLTSMTGVRVLILAS